MYRSWVMAAVAAAATVGAACSQQPPAANSTTPAATAAPAAPTPVERGKYLVNAIGCNDCHTPKTMGPNGPEPDMTRLLSGQPEADKLPPAPKPDGPWIASTTPNMTAWAGPWGVSFAANLTPDRNTGLGIWTEQMFVTAIREGKHMGTSRPILPPMPWQDLRMLSDADLKAIFAYLQSIPAIANHVPDPIAPAK